VLFAYPDVIHFWLFIDKPPQPLYNTAMLTLQNHFGASESYTHDNWVYQDVYVGFSRLYYIIDGEGYYEENGQVTRFKKGYLYLTPVKQKFTLYDNPQNKLLHTYAHITTIPAVTNFIELEVPQGSLLADAVALYRKHIHADPQTLSRVIQLLLSCIEQTPTAQTVAEKTKRYLDHLTEFSLDMASLSRAVGYSREHITRSFLATYHLTPKQYLEQGRMNTALQLLIEGNKVFEVADLVHFSSPYAFSKAFKRHFGLSPEKYLAILKKQS